MSDLKLFLLVFFACSLASVPAVQAAFKNLLRRVGIILISAIVGFFSSLVWITMRAQQEIARRRRKSPDPSPAGSDFPYNEVYSENDEKDERQLDLEALPAEPEPIITEKMVTDKIGELKDYDTFLRATDAFTKAKSELIGDDLTKKLVSIFNYASELVKNQNQQPNAVGGNSGT